MTNEFELRDRHNLDGLLVVISGPSGVGKGTICKEVLKEHPELTMSISVTTRDPRPGERDGVHYFFRSKEDFKMMIEQDLLLEYANVYGNDYYGTPKEYVHQELYQGNDVILEIDVRGALQVKKNFPRAILIFIAPPSLYELERRLTMRGTEDQEKVNERLQTAVEELQEMRSYDYLVVNDVVENARDKVIQIINAEKCRIENNLETILKLTGRA